MRVSCALLVIALAACGGSNNPGNPDAGNPGGTACTVTLSGAVTATLSCTAMVGGYTGSQNTGAIATTVSGSPTLSVALNYAGDLHTGSFTQAIVSKSSGITVQSSSSSTQVWAALAGGSTSQGTWTITLNDLGTSVPGSGGDKAYPSLHGSFDATLPAVPGSTATGTVTAHATF